MRGRLPGGFERRPALLGCRVRCRRLPRACCRGPKAGNRFAATRRRAPRRRASRRRSPARTRTRATGPGPVARRFRRLPRSLRARVDGRAPVTAPTMSRTSSRVSMSHTNDRSSLSLSAGNWCRYASDDWPVPKSSRATRTPMIRSCISRPLTAAGFSIATPSVNSTTRQRAGRPASRRASAMSSTSDGWLNCGVERFTDTQASPRQSGRLSCHAFSWRQASRRVHSPSGTMKPVFSASGMNSAGETRPRRRVLPSDQGLESGHAVRGERDDRLEVEHELAPGERLHEVGVELEFGLRRLAEWRCRRPRTGHARAACARWRAVSASRTTASAWV